MSTERVVRICGDAVARPRRPWTPTIQSFLQHLYDCGLPVPQPLGYDERSEYVRFVEGDAGEQAWPHQLDLLGLRSVGVLLRQVHEASKGWRAPAEAEWSVPPAPSGVICHGDPQPANFAWREGRVVGLFDWDAARPAAAISDVAYALLWFTPINADDDEIRRRGFSATPDRQARAEALLEAYGWDQPLDILQASLNRYVQAIDEVVLLGDRGYEPHAHWVRDGWPDRWRTGIPSLADIELTSSYADPPASRQPG